MIVSAKAPAPIFLISTGRTGTKYFSKLFQAHSENTVTFHTSKHTRLIHIANNMHYLGIAPQGLPKWLWQRLKVPVIKAAQGQYIECNPYYYQNIPFIWKTFPQARIIFAIRNPREFICSHIRWERQRLMSRIANQLIPFWAPVPYWQQFAGISGNLYQRVAYYARIWTRKNTVIKSAIADDSRAVSLRFEDVFANPNGVEKLTELFEWLELPLIKPIEQGVIKKRENITHGNAIKWDNHCEAIMIRECHGLMDEFGYRNATAGQV